MIGGPAYFGPQEIRSTVGYGDVLEPVAAALRDYSRGLGTRRWPYSLLPVPKATST
ncbi:hypothetical protein QBA75_41135 [Streptomyces stelliscabiei]